MGEEGRVVVDDLVGFGFAWVGRWKDGDKDSYDHRWGFNAR